MSEKSIMAAIKAAVNLDGRARLVRNNTGLGRALRSEDKIRYGLGNGGADLVGLLRSGRAIAIEVKTPIGRLSDDQRAWATAFRAWGGFYAVARSAPHAMAAIDRAIQGASE